MSEANTRTPAKQGEPTGVAASSEASWPAGIWQPVAALRAEMDRVFETFWQSFGGTKPASLQRPWRFDAPLGSAVPPVDVLENEKDFRIVAELPGLSVDDIDISVSDDLLTVKGEKADDREEKANNYRISERRFGSFKRSFQLPRGVDAEKVEAKFDKGVLTITMPKPAEAAARQKKIAIKSGS